MSEMNMALTEIEKDWVTQLIINTANATAERVGEAIVAAHLEACPYGKRLAKWVYISIGIGIGVGIVLGARGDEMLTRVIEIFAGN